MTVSGQTTAARTAHWLLKLPPFPTRPEDDDARIDAIARVMLKTGKPFQLLTTGCMSNVAHIAVRHPAATKMWSSVTCMAGLLDGDPECNARLDGKGLPEDPITSLNKRK